jgi:hypothetical protein
MLAGECRAAGQRPKRFRANEPSWPLAERLIEGDDRRAEAGRGAAKVAKQSASLCVLHADEGPTEYAEPRTLHACEERPWRRADGRVAGGSVQTVSLERFQPFVSCSRRHWRESGGRDRPGFRIEARIEAFFSGGRAPSGVACLVNSRRIH